MNRDEVEKHLKDRSIAICVQNLSLNINLLPPDGAKVHRKNEILGAILRSYEIAEQSFSNLSKETFVQLKRRSSQDYKRLVDRVYSAHNELGIKL